MVVSPWLTTTTTSASSPYVPEAPYVPEDIAISPVRSNDKGDSMFVVVVMVCIALVCTCCAGFIIARRGGFRWASKSQIIGLARGKLYHYFFA
jgi:hypothetical protein